MEHDNDNERRTETVKHCAHEMLQSLLATEDILLGSYAERLRAPTSELLQIGKLRLAIAICCSLHGHAHTRHIVEQVMSDFSPSKNSGTAP